MLLDPIHTERKLQCDFLSPDTAISSAGTRDKELGFLAVRRRSEKSLCLAHLEWFETGRTRVNQSGAHRAPCNIATQLILCACLTLWNNLFCLFHALAVKQFCPNSVCAQNSMPWLKDSERAFTFHSAGPDYQVLVTSNQGRISHCTALSTRQCPLKH